MKKTVGTVLLLGLMLLSSALTIIVVQASRPAEVNGKYSAIPPPSYNVIASDGKSDNTKQDTVIRTIWEGSITGIGDLEMDSTNLNDGALDERGVVHGVVTLKTGISVFGVVKTGSLTIKIHNVITAGDKSGGVWRIVGGTGELKGLHGEGTLEMFSFLPKIVIAYTGQVHYEP